MKQALGYGATMESLVIAQVWRHRSGPFIEYSPSSFKKALLKWKLNLTQNMPSIKFSKVQVKTHLTKPSLKIQISATKVQLFPWPHTARGKQSC
ncbi:unnamed protein product [Camellia sinensis]